jgi:hypothetical protein
MRPFLPKRPICLLESLTLIDFLERFDVTPELVFGVRTDPFEAHCWVQCNGVVLNESIDRVRQFTPIMIA